MEGGRISGEGNYKEGEECELTAYSDEGYKFMYWQKADGSTIKDNPYKFVVTNEISLKAVFQKESFKLKYIIDGEVYKESIVEFGESIKAEDNPVMEGYSFSGWSGIPDSMPAHDVNIYGSWIKNIHHVLYFVDGVLYASDEYGFGDVIIILPELQKDGYIFSGWSECPDVMPDEDVMIYGYFVFDAVEEHIIENDGVNYSINGIRVDRFISGEVTITNGKKYMIVK